MLYLAGTDVHDSGVCAGKDCIFVLGGRQRGQGACRFDLETNEWMDLPDMNTARRCPGKSYNTWWAFKRLWRRCLRYVNSAIFSICHLPFWNWHIPAISQSPSLSNHFLLTFKDFESVYFNKEIFPFRNPFNSVWSLKYRCSRTERSFPNCKLTTYRNYHFPFIKRYQHLNNRQVNIAKRIYTLRDIPYTENDVRSPLW